MGFKENINQEIWGNPDESVIIDDYNLYAPYKPDWKGVNETSKKFSSSNNYRNLLINGDLPPLIDETICPYGINKKSALANPVMISGYKQGGQAQSVEINVSTNTEKGQKPVYFAFTSFNTDISTTNQTLIANNAGYMEYLRNTSGLNMSNTSQNFGYTLLDNINLKRLVILPVIIAAKEVKNINTLGIYNTSDNFYDHFPNQRQFTVYEYFNGESDGMPYTEQYPYVLGVYGCLFYQPDTLTKIPNVSLLSRSVLSDSALTAYPALSGHLPYWYLSYQNYIDTKSSSNAPAPENHPHYITVAGHVSNQNTAFVSGSNNLNIRNIDTEEKAISEAYTGGKNRNYFTYFLPEELTAKLKTGEASTGTYDSTIIAWYEGLTEEECYKQTAYSGLPFCTVEMTMADAVDYIVNTDITQDNFRQILQYPDFSANMVTTGTYSPYSGSASPLKDTEWLYDIEENYDPEISFPWAVSFTAIAENEDGSYSNLENAVFRLQYGGIFKRTPEIFHNIRIDIPKQIKPEYEVLPKHRRTERTFSWLGVYCRPAKHFEYLALSEENIIYISHVHLLLERL